MVVNLRFIHGGLRDDYIDGAGVNDLSKNVKAITNNSNTVAIL